MNTITLPDHISFEEIAAKWCETDVINYSDFYITFHRRKDDGITASFIWMSDDGDETEVAWFVINEKKFTIEDGEEDLFEPILNYIKERSHG